MDEKCKEVMRKLQEIKSWKRERKKINEKVEEEKQERE